VRIFLDANVLSSAAKSDGFVRRLLELLVSKGHSLCADAYVAEEARRNLAAKAAVQLPALAALLDTVEVAATQAMPRPLGALSGLPEKDRPVLAAAMRLKCDVLVTGDRTHFGRFYGREVGGVRIHSPRTLAELLL
jgi:predicted nucleic acid-binding protein